jgi:glycosyltransferase involved in cell wall biosynthesis
MHDGSGTLLLIRPARGGVGAASESVAGALGRRGWNVRMLAVGRGRWPALEAARALLRHRGLVRSADVVHVEFGRLDGAAFWCGLLCTLGRDDVALVAHDAPTPLLRSPAAALVPAGGRWRDALVHRVIAPPVDVRLRRMLERRAGVRIALGKRAARAWAARTGAPVAAVEHGADPPTPGRPEPSAGRYVLFAGYLGPSKGLDVLLEAWGDVGPSSGLPLLIAGEPATAADEPYVRRLQRHSQRLPHPPRWLGALDDRAFARAFADAAVVVLPYLASNPASGVLVRAMTEGRAIVASRVPAFEDALTDGANAVLVAPGSAAELAAGLEAVIRDGRLRDALGRGAARAARDRFSWSGHVRALERAYAGAAGA